VTEYKSKTENDELEDFGPDLDESIAKKHSLNSELSFLFGEEVVDQAEQIDIVNLNLNDDITKAISTGIKQLKSLKNNPEAQLGFINSLTPGSRIVLCMWIMEMDLLDKIQSRSYLAK
jgi:hypothetical protein